MSHHLCTASAMAPWRHGGRDVLIYTLLYPVLVIFVDFDPATDRRRCRRSSSIDILATSSFVCNSP
jgi:hypothetical protein